MAEKLQAVLPDKYWPFAGDKATCEWRLWAEDLDRFFTITDAGRTTKLTDPQKNSYAVTLLGAEGRRQWSLHPAAAQEKAMAHTQFMGYMRTLFAKPKNQVRAHFEFNRCLQSPHQSIQDYLLTLRELLQDTEFHGHNNYHLAIQLACGCRSKDAQERLLAEKEPDLDRFINILEAQESSTADTSKIRGESSVSGVSKCTRQQQPSRQRSRSRNREVAFRNNPKQSTSSQCQGCGSSKHPYKDSSCPARDKQCHKCGVTGHFASMCRGHKKGFKTKALHVRVSAVGQSPVKSFQSTVLLREAKGRLVPLTADVDSCSDLTGIPVSMYQRQFKDKQLEPIQGQISNFDGSLIDGVLGRFRTEVHFGGQAAMLYIHVLPERCAPVIGRDAITQLQMVLDGATGRVRSLQEMRLTSPSRTSSVYSTPAESDPSSARGIGTELRETDALSLAADTPCGSPPLTVPRIEATSSLEETEPVKAQASTSYSCGIGDTQAVGSLSELAPEYKAMLLRYSNLLEEEIGLVPDFEHKIVLHPDAVPVVRKLRPIPIYRKDGALKEIVLMEKQGIWSKVDRSQWVHHLVTVDKPGGGVRITSDLSPLNKYAMPLRFPLPNIRELFLELREAKYFSKLDLKKYFYNIALDEESRLLTTTITPLGLYAYNRLPMGYVDSGAVSQKIVQEVLKNCPGARPYIDDIVIFGSTKEEHDKNLEQVLAALSAANLRLQPTKCVFGATEITLLGHVVGHGYLKPHPGNLQAIRDMETPTNLTQVQSFLGLLNYNSDYLPDVAALTEPLRALTRKGIPFVWNPERQLAFDTLKKMTCENLKLGIFDPNAPTFVTTDASNVGIGGVLSQIQNGVEVPIAYGHHTLDERQRGYAVNEREGLAAVYFCEYWEKYLLGRHFTLRTDHQSLTTLLREYGRGRKSGKFARWYERLSIFDYTLQYRRGDQNQVADALSRLRSRAADLGVPIRQEDTTVIKAVTKQGWTVEAFKQGTESDSVLCLVKTALNTSWPPKKKITPQLSPYYQNREDLSVDSNGYLLKDNHRIVVPLSMQSTLMERAHVGHPGIVRMKRKLKECYWWPGLDKQTEHFVRICFGCQDSAKSAPKLEIPVESIPKPTRPWQKVAIDITGKFSNSPENKEFLVVVIDYYSSFPELLNTGTGGITSQSIITWLKEVFARYGYPDQLVSDNGKQFTSAEFENFLSENGIEHLHIPVYNPERNGLVEVFNRFIKFGSQTFSASHQQWAEGLIDLLLQFRATAPTPTRRSPGDLMFNHRMRMGHEVVHRASEAEGLDSKPDPIRGGPSPPTKPALRSNLKEEGDRGSKKSVRWQTPLTATKLFAKQQPPQFLSQSQTKRDLPSKTTTEKEPEGRTLHRGPYHKGDRVRVRRPHSPKGVTPYSRPLTVLEVLGNWTYRLSDNQMWNARRMRRFYEPTTGIDPPDDQPPPQQQRPETPPQPRHRRTERANAGVPGERYSPSPIRRKPYKKKK